MLLYKLVNVFGVAAVVPNLFRVTLYIIIEFEFVL